MIGVYVRERVCLISDSTLNWRVQKVYLCCKTLMMSLEIKNPLAVPANDKMLVYAVMTPPRHPLDSLMCVCASTFPYYFVSAAYCYFTPYFLYSSSPVDTSPILNKRAVSCWKNLPVSEVVIKVNCPGCAGRTWVLLFAEALFMHPNFCNT